MVITVNILLLGGFTMSNFKDAGYIKVEGLVDAQTVKTISQYFENKINRGEWVGQCEIAASAASKLGYYSDPLIEVMLKECLPTIEEKTNLNLYPTYSYSRVYQENEQLLPHTDRSSCEVSVTVNVAKKGDKWPIWMQYNNNEPARFDLEAGDAVIYKGCEVTHWRRPLAQNNLNVQFMLHYVDKNGPYAEYKFDKRETLGLDALADRS
jgi:hypothetical protein|tara:strand:- start:165 stop:791 length:627 start_codon:yes stop_codon:yes gene_type:complete